MPIPQISKIEELVDEKIIAFNNYKELTLLLADASLDKIPDILEQRQNLITVIDGFEVEINSLVRTCKQSEVTTINAILKYANVECTPEYISLKNKLDTLKDIIMQVITIENDVETNFEKLQSDLGKQLEKSNKSRQVIDFCKSFNVDVSKGSAFNSKS